MSYTESDVIQQIFESIKHGHGIFNIKETLLRWYKHQKSSFEVNKFSTKDLDEKIAEITALTSENGGNGK